MPHEREDKRLCLHRVRAQMKRCELRTNEHFHWLHRFFVTQQYQPCSLLSRLTQGQIGTHEPQHLSRIERQPNNPGIAARSKDLREQVLPEGSPSAWRFVTDKEMPFLPVVQQLRPVTGRSLVRR